MIPSDCHLYVYPVFATRLEGQFVCEGNGVEGGLRQDLIRMHYSSLHIAECSARVVQGCELIWVQGQEQGQIEAIMQACPSSAMEAQRFTRR